METKIPGIIMLLPNRVWRTYTGGKLLDSIEGRPNPKDSHLPEDWIGSTTKASNIGREELKDEGLSKVNLDNKVELLKSIIESYPEEILGNNHYSKYGPVPQFLLKFLDSNVRLHIQAHPTVSFSKKYLHSSSGKTEAYVILSVRDGVPNPHIYIGFNRDISSEAFKRVVINQDISGMLSFLNKIIVKPGDVFMVPGGLPHAIGEGIFMIEIMEPTDFVVRLEFEKSGYVLPEKAKFMGRDVDFAMSMINFSAATSEQIEQSYFCKAEPVTIQSGSEEYVLIDERKTRCFSVHKLKVFSFYIKEVDSFYTGIITKGKGEIIVGNEQVKVNFGDKFLVPFQTSKVEFKAEVEMEIVLVFPPK